VAHTTKKNKKKKKNTTKKQPTNKTKTTKQTTLQKYQKKNPKASGVRYVGVAPAVEKKRGTRKATGGEKSFRHAAVSSVSNEVVTKKGGKDHLTVPRSRAYLLCRLEQNRREESWSQGIVRHVLPDIKRC